MRTLFFNGPMHSKLSDWRRFEVMSSSARLIQRPAGHETETLAKTQRVYDATKTRVRTAHCSVAALINNALCEPTFGPKGISK